MSRLPLFPLGMVLFPGLVLPLHVFEERYRALVGELMELPDEQRRMGVVAIRSGREVGADGVSDLHEIGCVAWLRRVEAYDDGRYDVVTTGAERFRLLELHRDKPYLVGDVELLGEDRGDVDETAVLDRAVRAGYRAYLAALGAAGGEELAAPELPADPAVLSYLVAASVVVDLDQRQALLAEPDVESRLRAELALLRREVQLLKALTSTPAPELARGPISPN